MARRKRDEIDYEKLHNSSMEDVIAEPTEEELEQARLEGEEERLEEEENQEDIQPQQTQVESPEEEIKEVEWDPEAFEKRMEEKFGKLSEETAKKVVESVSGKTEKTTETDEELISPWDKEKRTPRDYNEITDWAIRKKEILDYRMQASRAEEEQRARQAAEESNKTQLDSYNRFIDDQIDDLQKAGKIKDVDERRALFQTMLDVNLERQENGQPPIYSLKEIYYEYYQPPVREVPGADAPVSPGQGAIQPEDKEVDYRDVHNKSLIDILMGK